MSRCDTSRLREILSELRKERIRRKRKIEYFNIPCSFDIESSSFYQDGEKRACMYEWTLCLNGWLLYGRTWDEFAECCRIISEDLWLAPDQRRLVIYIHNLSFEFQWLKDRFEWETIFSTAVRKPLYAVTKTGIEFRCSYLLSGVSLAKMGKDLRDYPVEKLVGDLDYSQIRLPTTPLTDAELAYCRNDVLVVTSYIWEQIKQSGSVAKIPLTKTGKVREF